MGRRGAIALLLFYQQAKENPYRVGAKVGGLKDQGF
jgi:hypothetical protein